MSTKEKDHSWTIQKVLNWSHEFLLKKGIEEPRLAAEWLLADLLDYSRMELFLHFDKPLEKSELADYRELLKRRSTYEPTQYILGSWEFWSLDLKVDHRVLIPRPETECLIEETIKLSQDGYLKDDGIFLDLGTGSGAISCALAKEFSKANIHAVDISKDALDVAKENAIRCNVEENIQFYHGDLFEPISEHRFSLIVSNPPYIATRDLDALQKEIRLFEPISALDGGEDGLDIIRKILSLSPKFLDKDGILLMEIGSDQGEIVLKEAKKNLIFQDVRIIQDYAKKDRIVACFMSKFHDVKRSDLTIESNKNQDGIV